MDKQSLLKCVVTATLVMSAVMAGQALLVGLFYDPLIFIEISPRSINVDPGAQVDLHVDGIYTSATMPVKANWFESVDGEFARVSGCRQVVDCTVTAPDSGMKLIKAEVWEDGLVTDGVRVRAK